ncbi:MAG: hypothetical protein J6X69_01445 [Bacteroidales bacterium]|nr:hypothetical protein [Bacteroidales bacterium]
MEHGKMTEGLQRRLFEEGKELYKLRDLSCPEECLMGLGICCPDEWFPQLLALTRILERHNTLHPESAVHATQVKCKFGHLCFHTDHRATGDEDFIVFIIAAFEEMICASQHSQRSPQAHKG